MMKPDSKLEKEALQRWSNKITKEHLISTVWRINAALGKPQDPWKVDGRGKPIRDENGGLIANEGVVYLAGAYGGWKLEQMSKGGGSRDLSSTGYVPKRQLYELAQMYLLGLETRNGNS